MLFIFLLLILFLIPQNVFAWGAITHLHFGNQILANIASLNLSTHVLNLLRLFPHDFLYGCILADVILGKRLMNFIFNCHNWNMGFNVQKLAKRKHEKAFALGYLSHLAADVISHNYFIPTQMIKSYENRLLRHFYWEIRFDSLISNQKLWDQMNEIIKERHSDDDKLLERSLKFSLFSFRTHKQIFDGILLTQRIKRLQKAMKDYGKKSQFPINKKEKEDLNNLSIGMIYDFLKKREESIAILSDPTGLRNIKIAKVIRKNLRKAKRKKNLPEKEFQKIFSDVKKNLKDGILQNKK